MSTVTPVAFIIFNRPDATREAFARIRQAQPRKLFLIADGPRPDRPADVDLCAAVREVVANVDWPCEVQRDYADANMGLKRRVSSGLAWVFSNAERAIVLEDDCVPHLDFFGFCDELLDRYADDPRIAVITGDNFQQGIRRGDASYYFSKYNHVWGWATWERAWRHYDGDLTFWHDWRSSDQWQSVMPDAVERKYWTRIFDRAAHKQLDSWAYPWTASTWFHGGLTVTPNVNLVTNIGFGADATHTTRGGENQHIAAGALGALTHPPTVQVDVAADRYTFDHHFGGAELRARRRPIGFAKWFVAGTIRTLKRKLGASV